MHTPVSQTSLESRRIHSVQATASPSQPSTTQVVVPHELRVPTEASLICSRAFIAAESLWNSVPKVAHELFSPVPNSHPLSLDAQKLLFAIGALSDPQFISELSAFGSDQGSPLPGRSTAAIRIHAVTALPDQVVRFSNSEAIRTHVIDWLGCPRHEVAEGMYKALASACVHVPDPAERFFRSGDASVRSCFYHLQLGASADEVGIACKFFIWVALMKPTVQFNAIIGELGTEIIRISRKQSDTSIQAAVTQVLEQHPIPRSIAESVLSGFSNVPLPDCVALGALFGITGLLVFSSPNAFAIGIGAGMTLGVCAGLLSIGRELLIRSAQVHRYNVLRELLRNP